MAGLWPSVPTARTAGELPPFWLVAADPARDRALRGNRDERPDLAAHSSTLRGDGCCDRQVAHVVGGVVVLLVHTHAEVGVRRALLGSRHRAGLGCLRLRGGDLPGELLVLAGELAVIASELLGELLVLAGELLVGLLKLADGGLGLARLAVGAAFKTGKANDGEGHAEDSDRQRGQCCLADLHGSPRSAPGASGAAHVRSHGA